MKGLVSPSRFCCRHRGHRCRCCRHRHRHRGCYCLHVYPPLTPTLTLLGDLYLNRHESIFPCGDLHLRHLSQAPTPVPPPVLLTILTGYHIILYPASSCVCISVYVRPFRPIPPIVSPPGHPIPLYPISSHPTLVQIVQLVCIQNTKLTATRMIFPQL